MYYFSDGVDEEYILVYTYIPDKWVYDEIFDAMMVSKDILEKMDREKLEKTND